MFKNLKYLAFIAVSFIAVFFYFDFNYKENEKSIIDEKLNDYKTKNKVVISIFREFSDEIYNNLLNTQDVKRYLNTNQRNLLAFTLESHFERLKNVGISNIHFHTKEGKSFLRLHNPKKFGDDLSKIRKTVNYMVENKRRVEAFEVGRSYPAYRFLYPIFYNNQFIGSVEIAYPLEIIVNKIEQVYKLHSHILLKSSIIEKNKFFNEYKKDYSISSEHPNYSYLNDIHVKKEHIHDKDYLKQNPDVIENIYTNINNNKSFGLTLALTKKDFVKEANISKNKEYYLMSFLPIKDLDNEIISYIVIYEKSEQIKAYYLERNIYTILTMLLILFLTYVFYKQNKNKIILEKLVENRTKQLNDELKTNQQLNENLSLINEQLELHQEELRVQNDELSQTKIQLLEKYNEIEALFNNIKNPTFITDKEFYILDSNYEAKNLFKIFKSLNQNKQLLSLINDKRTFFKLVQDNDEYKSVTIPFKCHNQNIKRFKTNIIKHPTIENQYVISLIDIENELTYLEELRKKDLVIYENAKLLSLKDMISNIAHHWRQPLNFISITASSSKIELEYDMSEKEKLISNLSQINSTAKELSNTIEMFGNYINKVDEVVTISVKDIVDYALNMQDNLLSELNIKVITNLNDSCQINTYKEEFIEVLINLINNSKDAFENKNIKNPTIKIDLEESDENVTLNFTDNAGGIQEEHLEKIFEPYFTTKFKNQGVGLSLFNSRRIVTERLNGQINVENTNDGAKFSIIIKK